MAIHFHPLVVKEIKKQTPDCVAVSFTIPDQLKQEFTFTHGQNITLKTMIYLHSSF
jgi:ring-1,2-phenylacetyl-CoA epoxidase subunit PaaE